MVLRNQEKPWPQRSQAQEIAMSETGPRANSELDEDTSKFIEVTAALGILSGYEISDALITQPVSELQEPNFFQRHEAAMNITAGLVGAGLLPILIVAVGHKIFRR